MNRALSEVESVEFPYDTYEMREEDFSAILDGFLQVEQSGLVDSRALEGVRIISTDSRHTYITTRGQQNLPLFRTVNDVHIYRTAVQFMEDSDEKDPRDRYSGANAWAYYQQVNETAQKKDQIPYFDQGRSSVKAVYLPALTPYTRIHDIERQDGCDYQYDCVFHELGHIEGEPNISRAHSEKLFYPFGSAGKQKEFIIKIRSSNRVPEAMIQFLTETIGPGAISEMLAMIVDQEAKRRYAPERLQKKQEEIDMLIHDLSIVLQSQLATDNDHLLRMVKQRVGKEVWHNLSPDARHIFYTDTLMNRLRQLPLEKRSDRETLMAIFKEYGQPPDYLNDLPDNELFDGITTEFDSQSRHIKGQLFAMLLADLFPDYQERKKWIHGLLKPGEA